MSGGALNRVIQIEDQFYILASATLADERTRVLKQGDTFAVFDCYGDIQPYGRDEQGLYFDGTRFLSPRTPAAQTAHSLTVESESLMQIDRFDTRGEKVWGKNPAT